MTNQAAWKNLKIELESLRLAVGQEDVQKMMNGDLEHIENYPEASRQLKAVSTFARRSAEVIEELARENEVTQQRAVDEPFQAESVEGDSHTLGNNATVTFPAFNGAEMSGKVDTGATTSSLHASNIRLTNGRVSFQCQELSGNVITLPVEGSQEVHSADYGGDKRPVVHLDVTIDGVQLNNVMFNLNDRGDMDSKLLIGQDVLKAGNFQVDVNKDSDAPMKDAERIPESEEDITDGIDKVYEAVQTLADSQLTMHDFVRYLQTEAISRIKD